MKNDRQLDRWTDLGYSEQEVNAKKRLKLVVTLVFAAFAVRAAAPLLSDPFLSSCFRFFQVQQGSAFVSWSCLLKYLCFPFHNNT